MAHRMPRPSNNHNLRSATPRTPITPFLASPGTQHPSQKIRKGGKTLFCGPVKKSLGREQGTTVVVRDMYHNVGRHDRVSDRLFSSYLKQERGRRAACAVVAD